MPDIDRSKTREIAFTDARNEAIREVIATRPERNLRAQTPHDGQKCETCGETLPYGDLWGARCECERQRIRQRQEEIFSEVRDEVVATEWSRAGVPPRYASCRFDTFHKLPGTETALAACREWAESFDRKETTHGLFLVGGFGSGKTHLLSSTAHHAVERTLVRPHFASAGGLLQAVKGGEGLDTVPVRRAIECELLILDDLGQVGRTEFDREVMYSLVSERYDHLRPTLVSSNVPPDKLGDLLGGALASRLHQACRVLVMTASDFRRKRSA